MGSRDFEVVASRSKKPAHAHSSFEVGLKHFVPHSMRVDDIADQAGRRSSVNAFHAFSVLLNLPEHEVSNVPTQGLSLLKIEFYSASLRLLMQPSILVRRSVQRALTFSSLTGVSRTNLAFPPAIWNGCSAIAR